MVFAPRVRRIVHRECDFSQPVQQIVSCERSLLPLTVPDLDLLDHEYAVQVGIVAAPQVDLCADDEELVHL